MPLVPICLALILGAGALSAQDLEVRGAGGGPLVAQVGDTVTVEIVAHLGDLRASGLTLFLRLPAGLEPIDDGRGRPFRPGLFAGGYEFANQQLPAAQTFGQPAGAALLTYAAVLGPGTERHRSGSGQVAAVDLVCTRPVGQGRIDLVSNPAHASMLVLDDGHGELRLPGGAALPVHVVQPAARRGATSWGTLKASLRP